MKTERKRDRENLERKKVRDRKGVRERGERQKEGRRKKAREEEWNKGNTKHPANN